MALETEDCRMTNPDADTARTTLTAFRSKVDWPAENGPPEATYAVALAAIDRLEADLERAEGALQAILALPSEWDLFHNALAKAMWSYARNAAEAAAQP